jgi:hypothetical protein
MSGSICNFTGSQTGASDLGMSALAQMLQGKKLTIEDKSPGDEAIEVTPAG